MASICLTVLGTFGAQRAGITVTLPTRKAEALLAFLACRPGETQPRDRLTALLWGDRGDEQARHSLSQTLCSLRKAFGDSNLLVAERNTVVLRAEAADIDVVAFQKLGASDDPADLQAALALYRGPLLDGFSLREAGFEEWLAQERTRLHGLAFEIALRLADHHIARSEHDAAIAALGSAIALDPLAEDVHRRLMRISLDRGAYNEAIRQFRLCADTLQRELGTAPEPATTALHREAMGRLRACATAAARSVDLHQNLCATLGTAIDHAHSSAANAEPGAEALGNGTARRASIAVMPFRETGAPIGAPDGAPTRHVRGLTHDIITRLAKLRCLFVIAEGSVFALAEKGAGPAEAGRLLNVDYVAGGSVEHHQDRIIISVELVECRSARIIWTESYEHRRDDTFAVLDQIGNSVVASIASEVETAERNRAILRPPNSLDAWEALHCGLWHMYRFTAADNERAHHFFRLSTRIDPTFSRAHAGLSFTHFQNAFLWHPQQEREREIGRAIDMAAQALIADDRDPAAHWAMGRALWLHGEFDQSLAELESAVELSPNFALGHYALAFSHSQSGDARAALDMANRSRSLSPFDPMLFAMLAARALAHVRLGEFDQAAEWAVKSATRPNSHAHVLGIAAGCLALAGRLDEARAFVARIHKTRPHYSIDDFLGAFRFAPDAVALFRGCAPQIGLARSGRISPVPMGISAAAI